MLGLAYAKRELSGTNLIAIANSPENLKLLPSSKEKQHVPNVGSSLVKKVEEHAFKHAAKNGKEERKLVRLKSLPGAQLFYIKLGYSPLKDSYFDNEIRANTEFVKELPGYKPLEDQEEYL